MMNLTPTELERLTIFQAAELARRYRSLKIRLSHPEAVALIADEMLTAARRDLAYDEIVDLAGRLLTADDVQPGVAGLIPFVSVEANFAEGTKMVIVFKPVGPGAGPAEEGPVPGEIITPEAEIELNAGRACVTLDVVNTGDRDIQVRSHAHFFETNRALEFDRRRAYGMRLDAPSGVGVRFEPGMRKAVTLVALGGGRVVRGQAGLVDGALDEPGRADRALAQARARAYRGA
jgi:urease subunit gamma/beta